MTRKPLPDLSALIAEDRAAGPAAEALRAALPPPAETLAAYLAGTLAEAERARVEAWLAADPAHRDLLDDLGATVAAAPAIDAALAARLAALETVPHVTAPRLARPRRSVFGFRWAGAFASIALLVLAGILVVPTLMQRQSALRDDLQDARNQAKTRSDPAAPAPRRAEEAERRPAEPPAAVPPEEARRPAPPSPPASGSAAPPSVRLAATPALLAAIRAAAAEATAEREADRARRAAADPLAPFNAACPSDWPRCCAAVRLDPALVERVRRGEAPAAFQMILLGRKPQPGLCEVRAAP